jgi:queuine/archaeosine tRNA-ribosyltransferase
MNIDERLESVARNLDMLIRIHLDSEREYRERLDKSDEQMERSREQHERSREQHERSRERLDRIEGHLESLTVLVQQDGEHIRALARIAERHQDRLDNLDPQ